MISLHPADSAVTWVDGQVGRLRTQRQEDNAGVSGTVLSLAKSGTSRGSSHHIGRPGPGLKEEERPLTLGPF